MPSEISEDNKKLNELERDDELTILDSFPQRIVFETTNKCNLRCEMCAQSYRDFKAIHMSLETFEKTKSFWPYAYDVSLFGWGEPLLNPKICTFFEVISAYKPRVFILTNAMLLTNKKIEKFVEGGLSFLNFSVDAATAETYNKIRRGADFTKVIKNITKVVEKKRAAGANLPYLRMVFVGMRQNIHEFPQFVELAAKLGMDEAKMVHMIAYGENTRDHILFFEKELTNKILDKAKEKAKGLGIKLTIPDKFNTNNSELNNKSKKHKKCFRPWEELFVQCDGKVRLCMLSNEIMGDIKNGNLVDIWNSRKFQEIRKTINSDSPIGTCACCPQYKEMNVNDINAFIQIETDLPGTKKNDL